MCVCMVPYDGLMSYPWCILISCPLFLGVGSRSTMTLTGITHSVKDELFEKFG